jgi:hypothetical protein
MVFASAIVDSNPTERISRNLPERYSIIDKIEVEYIKEISGGEVLYLELYIGMDKLSIKDIRSYNLAKGKKELSFFESFGFDYVFKDLFSDLNRVTTLSKKEISYLLRKEIACRMVTNEWAIFKFKIPKSKINDRF